LHPHRHFSFSTTSLSLDITSSPRLEREVAILGLTDPREGVFEEQQLGLASTISIAVSFDEQQPDFSIEDVDAVFAFFDKELEQHPELHPQDPASLEQPSFSFPALVFLFLAKLLQIHSPPNWHLQESSPNASKSTSITSAVIEIDVKVTGKSLDDVLLVDITSVEVILTSSRSWR
jgi:hypothetical protein